MTELGERRDRNLPDAVALQESSTRRLDAEHDVLHHRQVRRERQLLIDHRDAGLTRVERMARRIRRAVDLHDAGVGLQRARQNPHQRALAGAVLPDERAHFTGSHGEVDLV